MALVTREQLTTSAAPEPKRVELPELGEKCYCWVHGMTARERSAFELAMREDDGGNLTIRERLCVFCVRDDDGNRILEAEDLEAIGKQHAPIIERIVDVAMPMCGYGSRGIEELEGN